MGQILIFLSVFLLFFPGISLADDAAPEDPAEEVIAAEEAVGITSEIIVLEDGTEEVLMIRSAAEEMPVSTDDRVAAIEAESREKVKAAMDEFRQLSDQSRAAELQREIGRIKLEAEINRLMILLEEAEDAGDSKQAKELSNEIQHLETLDEPVIGVPNEQPIPAAAGDSRKGGKK